MAKMTQLPRQARDVARATMEAIKTNGLPFKTITWDNGTGCSMGKSVAN